MKHSKYLFLFILVLFFAQHIAAGSISLDNVVGSVDDGGILKINANQPVTFEFRLINDGADVSGFTNGFRVWTKNGSSFTPASGQFLDPNLNTYFDLVLATSVFSSDGTGVDTVSFGGSKLVSTGFPNGYNGIPFSISTGGVPAGDTLCVDSSWFPPTGTWLWAPGGQPDWDGPHCFASEVFCPPVSITNTPIQLTSSHCNLMTFDFNADGIGGFTWSTNIGIINTNGVWTYQPTMADVGASNSLIVQVTDGCTITADTVDLNITNQAPVVTCPATQNVSTGHTNNFQIQATDNDGCDVLTFTLISDGGLDLSINPVTGLLTVTAVAAGVYQVNIEVSDGNLTSQCSFDVVAVPGTIYQIEIPCIGDQSSNFVYQGQHTQVPISLNTGNSIDGYDMLISYDNSALSFQFANPGADLVADRWEYFTYRFGPDGNCGVGCPSGILRVVAIAESNNGPYHPIIDGVNELFVLDFLVSNDRTLECQQVPIRFFWMDCGDNTVSSDGGNVLHVSDRVFDGDPSLFPPNGQDISNPEYGFPTFFGVQEECIVEDAGKPEPIRDISFNNGCIQIACADSIDARGDVNLNSVPNEIADAVLLSNYFVYGISVFTVNMQGQIAASDVNADGMTLTVADLVYLIRIIVGDALPYAKLAAFAEDVVVNQNVYSIESEMGAALMVLEGNAEVNLLADNMEIKSHYDNATNKTRVLIYSVSGESFAGEFVETDNKLVSIELASRDGAQVISKLIPGEYQLSQNYPNPFNPTTTFSFAIPKADKVTLAVYNISGQRIADFSGSYEAGTHHIEFDASAYASGVYFYKLETSEFSDTKKMLLLK